MPGLDEYRTALGEHRELSLPALSFSCRQSSFGTVDPERSVQPSACRCFYAFGHQLLAEQAKSYALHILSHIRLYADIRHRQRLLRRHLQRDLHPYLGHRRSHPLQAVKENVK